MSGTFFSVHWKVVYSYFLHTGVLRTFLGISLFDLSGEGGYRVAWVGGSGCPYCSDVGTTFGLCYYVLFYCR